MSFFVNLKLIPSPCGVRLGDTLPPPTIRREALPHGEARDDSGIVESLQKTILLNPRVSASFLGTLVRGLNGVSLGQYRVTLLTLLNAAFNANSDRYSDAVKRHLLRSVDALFGRDDRIKEDFTLPVGPLKYPLYSIIEALFGHLLMQTGEVMRPMTPRSYFDGVVKLRADFDTPETRKQRWKEYILQAFGDDDVFHPPSNEDYYVIRREELESFSSEELLGNALIVALERNDYFVAQTLMDSELFERVPLRLLCFAENSCTIQFNSEKNRYISRWRPSMRSESFVDVDNDLFALYPPMYCRLLEGIASHPEKLIRCSSKIFTLRFVCTRLMSKQILSSNLPTHLFARILLKRVNDLAAEGRLDKDLGVDMGDCLDSGIRFGESELVFRCLDLSHADPYAYTWEDTDDEDDDTAIHTVPDHMHPEYPQTRFYHTANRARSTAYIRGYIGLNEAITERYHLGPLYTGLGAWHTAVRPL